MKPILVLALLVSLAAQSSAFAQGSVRTGLQTLPGPLPNLNPPDREIAWDFDLTQERFFISVPKNYTGNQPFGLLVFLSPIDQWAELPPDWDTVLEDRNLIFVAPQKIGNNQPLARRAGLAVAAALKLSAMANVDPRRIYVSGLSGSARVACYAAFLRPALFSGVVAVCGAQFCEKVPRHEATRDDEYGYFPFDPRRADEAKEKLKFVLVTGPNDFRHGNILDIYKGGFLKDGYDAKLLERPRHGPRDLFGKITRRSDRLLGEKEDVLGVEMIAVQFLQADAWA